jgi:hypothetical protein
VLLITPRVIRNIERPGARLEEFNSGTELDVGAGGSNAPLPLPAIPQKPQASEQKPQPQQPQVKP